MVWVQRRPSMLRAPLCLTITQATVDDDEEAAKILEGRPPAEGEEDAEDLDLDVSLLATANVRKGNRSFE